MNDAPVNDAPDEPSGASGRSSARWNWASGIAVGLGVGLALGVALDSLPVGLALGAALAPAFVMAFRAGAEGRKADSTSSDEPRPPVDR